jgi:DNA-binding NtrC family response regulator
MAVPQGLLLYGGSQLRNSAWLDLEHDRTGPARSAATVMVVEDDDRVRRLTARMLRDEGYDVIEAGTGQEALKRLAGASEVHVVLTDIAMPGGMHGVELAERIVADSPGCQVVLMSGYASLFPKLGTYGTRFPLLIKPFSADQLYRQIREVLRGQH